MRSRIWSPKVPLSPRISAGSQSAIDKRDNDMPEGGVLASFGSVLASQETARKRRRSATRSPDAVPSSTTTTCSSSPTQSQVTERISEQDVWIKKNEPAPSPSSLLLDDHSLSDSDLPRRQPSSPASCQRLATKVSVTHKEKRKATPFTISATKSHTNEEEDDDDDDDDERDSDVEFLFHRPADYMSTTTTTMQTLTASNSVASTTTIQQTTIHSVSMAGLEDEAATSYTATMAAVATPLPFHDDNDNDDATSQPTESDADVEIQTACRSAAASSGTSLPAITPLTSAYLQNLAEISWTILHDQRWRIGIDQRTIFQWEHGDDLSVVLALSRRFIQPQAPFAGDDDDEDLSSCLLCGSQPDSKLPRQTTKSVQRPPPILQEQPDDRCLHLYCRLFYRKGPWFRLDDLFSKYYASRCSSTPSASSDDDDGKLQDTIFDAYMDQVEQLLTDITRLHEKGFIRGFASEKECGITIDSTLLTNVERGQVLSCLAAGKKGSRMAPCPPRTNVIWNQMKRQRPLFPSAGMASSSCLAVQRHVVAIVTESLAKMVCAAANPKSNVAAADIARIKKRIMHMDLLVSFPATVHLLAGFCFREEPHRTLARCARLYLCATSGPGSMRGDGTNGWRSLMQVNNPCSIAGIRPPGLHAWHLAEYPGLRARFGLASFPFQIVYQHIPVSHGTGTVVAQIFPTAAAFRAFECCIELRAHVDFAIELDSVLKYNERRLIRGLEPLGAMNRSSSASTPPPGPMDVDLLSLTSPAGRERIVRALLSSGRDDDSILKAIEHDITTYQAAFVTDCTKVLFATAIVAIHVLCRRNGSVSSGEYAAMCARPWLRHLWWDGNLAYLLWDIVPVLEKASHYLAVVALETLLFGRTCSTAPVCVISSIEESHDLATILLSRRTRGKAFARLFIDYRHLMAKERRALEDKTNIKQLLSRQSTSISRFFERTVSHTITSASIPFSSIRELARPMKRPLSDCIGQWNCLEALELGLRLQDVRSTTSTEPTADKYSEWTPVHDKAVANALANDENGPGSRCAYVGFEDGILSSSLNVEELAMEYYRTGRLPHGDVRGGWRGFHDEGGHVHTLFRVICGASLLGSGWGCACTKKSQLIRAVHLSPYQFAPFDLLVGHTQTGEQTFSFYENRRATVDSFLAKMSTLDAQQLSDLVYNSVLARAKFMERNSNSDPTCINDMSKLRTLSLLAAGLGGKALACIFRCFCFDYRHFRGGMPDLTLVRASFRDDDGVAHTVDLGEWVGESFSTEYEASSQARQAMATLNDEDFLGCSMGDAGGSSTSSRRSRLSTAGTLGRPSQVPSVTDFPERLVLHYNKLPVEVETMLVEVKSANDRLDSRQLDWLNILDIYGNARVCKFEKKSAKSAGITASEATIT